MPHAWDQRAGETPKSYARFMEYLSMGPKRPTMEQVGELWGLKRDTVRRLADRHDWTERCAAFDLHDAEQNVDGMAERRANFIERQMRIAERALKVLEGAVDALEVGTSPAEFQKVVASVQTLTTASIGSKDGENAAKAAGGGVTFVVEEVRADDDRSLRLSRAAGIDPRPNDQAEGDAATGGGAQEQ